MPGQRCNYLLVRPTDQPSRAGPCVHRGEVLRVEDCPTCSGHVRVKVFGCARHGECTIEKDVGAKVCRQCGDHASPPVQLAGRVLFLDDKQCRVDTFVRYAPQATIVRSAREASAALASGPWDLVFLDHDLNDAWTVPEAERETNSGTHVAEWIAEHRPQVRRLVIHSTNDPAARRMRDILRDYYCELHRFEDLTWSRPRSAILLRFTDGLGDHVQFTVVLRHLQVLRPDLEIDIQCNHWCRSLFTGLARNIYSHEQQPPGPYEIAHTVRCKEPKKELQSAYPDSPSTKSEIFLRENLKLAPRLDLCRYARLAVGIRSSGPPYCLIHHQGASWPARKNVHETALRPLIAELLLAGIEPVLLDWKNRSPLRYVRGVRHVGREGGCMEAGHLACLAAGATLNVGIDSGPGHIFGCVERPALIVWTGHHPLHYYGLSPNVTHLIPAGHERMILGNADERRQAATFFRHHYRWAIYDPGRIAHRLVELAAESMA